MKRARFGGITLAIAVIAVVAFTKWPRAEKAQTAARELKTATVEPASFDVSLAINGVVEAAKSDPIVNESRQTQIVWVLTDGASVKAGDLIMTLNDAQLKKEVADQERQDAEAADRARTELAEGTRRVQNAKAGLEKAKDDLKLAQVQGTAAIEKAQAELGFMQKELELAQGQYDKRKRLADEHLMPLTQVEQAADEARQKEFGRQKAERELERAKQDAATSEQVRQLGIGKAKLELASAESAFAQSQADSARSQRMRTEKLEEARQQLADTEVRAPSAGMLLLGRTWEDGERALRVGDQVHEGMRIANIIDPTQMRVRCDINESDIERVEVDQRALVQISAIGDTQLRGTVKTIDNLAREREIWEGGTPGKQVFAAAVVLTDSDKRIRPGMGAAVQITLEKANKGLAVPVEAVFTKKGKPGVYKRQADGYVEVPVTVIQRNEMTAAVSGNLKPDDTVACERPPAEMMAGAKERKK